MFEQGSVTSVQALRALWAVEEQAGTTPAILRSTWSDVLDGSLLRAVRLREAVVATMAPAERFAHETGLPATPEDGFVAPAETEEAAIALQARLVQLDRVARIAEARRLVALLESYEASIEDLRIRFGRDIGSRPGLGAQAFFRSTGLAVAQHPMQVAHLVDTALTARTRLPRTWRRFLTGETTWRAVDSAVRQAEGLDPERWDAYDEEAARLVVGSTRLKDALRKVRERLQDDTAPARARTTSDRRAAHLDEGADGSATFSLTGPAADLVAFDQALTKAAVLAHGDEPDGEARTVTQLRYDIARDLLLCGITAAATPAPERDPTGPTAAVPARRGVEVKLILTVPALAWLGHSTEQALLQGYGPIDLDTARELAGSARSMTRVLTDPVTGVRLTMDRTVYTPPADLKRWIGIRDQWCRFPGCRRPSHLCDIDHAHEWHDGGVTDDVNLISACRAHHTAKTAGLHHERLDDDGAVRWTDPWGTVTTDPPADPLDPAPRWLLDGHADPLDEPAPF